MLLLSTHVSVSVAIYNRNAVLTEANWYCIDFGDRKNEPQQFEEARLMFVLIRNAELFINITLPTVL
jgi:hypothetical protein